MDGERKYRQHGYQDGGAARPAETRTGSLSERFAPPRHPMDITAPRLPRMVQNVTATRCYACAVTLPAGFDFHQPCPKCEAALRCCKQCAHFDSAASYQCAKPVPVRIAAKDKPNLCTLFTPRVTVARESAKPPEPPKAAVVEAAPQEPRVSRTVHNARAAFENLFKK